MEAIDLRSLTFGISVTVAIFGIFILCLTKDNNYQNIGADIFATGAALFVTTAITVGFPYGMLGIEDPIVVQKTEGFTTGLKEDPTYLDKNAELMVEDTGYKDGKEITTSIYAWNYLGYKGDRDHSRFVVRKTTKKSNAEDKVEYAVYDQHSNEFQNLLKRMNFDFDRFSRKVRDRNR